MASRADRPAAPAPRPARRPAALLLACTLAVGACTPAEDEAPLPGGGGDLSVEADPVVVGAALPLSGPLAAFGQAQQRGVQDVLDRANAAGGVVVGGEPRRVELLALDSRGDADVAGQRALVLVRRREPAPVLLGACSPPSTVVRVAEARAVPLLSGCGPLALPDSPVAPASTWVLGPDDAAHAAAVATALGPASQGPVAVLTSSGRASDAHVAALVAAGHQVAGTWSRGAAGPRGGGGWREPVRAALDAGATRVLALTDPPDGGLLWQEVERAGWRPASAYVHDAALVPGWAGLPLSDGVVTDLHGEGGRTPEQVAEQAARETAEVLLEALGAARSARPADVARALAAGRARLLGTPGEAAPQLGTWRDGELVAQ